MEASRDKREVKPECAQKILKATTRNQREHRAQDKLEASQQRKAPSTQNDITQSTQRSNCEKSNMEDGEDQMYRGTRMQHQHKRKEGRQGLGRNRRTVVICGYSMVKGLSGWMMSLAKKVKVQSFPGVTCRDMDHYLQPIISRRPDHVILHIRTNDLSGSKSEEVVSKIVS